MVLTNELDWPMLSSVTGKACHLASCKRAIDCYNIFQWIAVLNKLVLPHNWIKFNQHYMHGRRKDFFQGVAKSGETWFFPLETKKTTISAEYFKIQGGQDPLPPLPAPMVVCLTMTPFGG